MPIKVPTVEEAARKICGDRGYDGDDLLDGIPHWRWYVDLGAQAVAQILRPKWPLP